MVMFHQDDGTTEYDDSGPEPTVVIIIIIIILERFDESPQRHGLYDLGRRGDHHQWLDVPYRPEEVP